MTAIGERQQRIAASFTRQYYTLMVQQPERLPEFYTQDAVFEHMGQKAEGTAEIEAAIKKLYPIHPNASVKVLTLSSMIDEKGNIHMTISGTIAVSTSISHNFTHEVELMEHETHPGSFGIVSDKRESVLRREAPKRWALETPPMFATEPPKEAMDHIVQLSATTAAESVEKSKGGEAARRVPTALSPASEKPSTDASTIFPTEPSVHKESEKPASTAPAEPAVPSVEVKKPKSFVEAIMMGKRSSAGQGHTTPITVVVVKGGKEHSTEAHTKSNTEMASAVERNGAKSTPRNSVNPKRATATHASGDGERKNGRPATERPTYWTNNKENQTNENNNHNKGNNKRKDADGRTLSRFVVFYDIIIKGLPTEATDQTVRDIVEPIAPVKLIKLLSQNDKKDPSMMRTFAFVQLDHSAIKNAGDDVKAMVAKVLEAYKGRRGPSGQRIQVDEVREKYTAAPTTSTSSATVAASPATPVETSA